MSTTQDILQNEILNDLNLVIADMESLLAANPQSRALTRVVGQLKSGRTSYINFLKGEDK